MGDGERRFLSVIDEFCLLFIKQGGDCRHFSTIRDKGIFFSDAICILRLLLACNWQLR